MSIKKNCLIFGGTGFSIYNFRLDLINELKKKFNIICVANIQPEDKTKLNKFKIKYIDSKIHNSKISILNDVKIIFNYYAFIKKKNPKIIIAYTFKSLLYIGILSFFFKKKNFIGLITGMGNLFLFLEKKKIFFFIYKKILKFLLKKYKILFIQNKDDFSFFKINKIQEKNIVLNPITGIQIKKFKIKPLPNNICFLMISRIIKNKGIVEYFEAANIVKKKFPYVQFNFLGDFENSEFSIKKNFLYLLEKKNVNFIKWTSNVQSVIKKNSILVLPSYREGTPRSILEGMSMGRGAIITNVPGCRHLIKNNFNGLLVKKKNSNDLAKKMIKIINKKSLIYKFGKNSSKFVSQNYNSKDIANKIKQEIIQNVRN